MRKNIFTKTRAFRMTPPLYQALESLATKANLHESDIIRQAVWAFVKYYQDRPEELVRVV